MSGRATQAPRVPIITGAHPKLTTTTWHQLRRPADQAEIYCRDPDDHRDQHLPPINVGDWGLAHGRVRRRRRHKALCSYSPPAAELTLADAT
jgi:hypothetical protein